MGLPGSGGALCLGLSALQTRRLEILNFISESVFCKRSLMEQWSMCQGLSTLTDARSHFLLSICLPGMCPLLPALGPLVPLTSPSHLAALFLGQKLGYFGGKGKGSCVPCPLTSTGGWPRPWSGWGSDAHLEVSQGRTRCCPSPRRLEAPWYFSRWLSRVSYLPSTQVSIHDSHRK